jgi:hypothetical protein
MSSDQPIHQGEILPRETPRRVRLPARIVIAFAVTVFISGVLSAAGVDGVLRHDSPIASGIMAVVCGLVVLSVLGLLCTFPGERRLLRSGTIAVAVVSPDRLRGTFRDASGREHTVPVTSLPANVGPGMAIPVVHPEGHPEMALTVSATWLEIVPIGRADVAYVPLPRIKPVWRGVAIQAETPRRVRIPTAQKILLGLMLAFAAALEALVVAGMLSPGATGDRIGLGVCALLILVGTFAFTRMRLRMHRLVTRGRVTTAHVLSCERVVGHQGHIHYQLTYAYDVDEVRYEGATPTLTEEVQVGATVPVFYDARDPKEHCLIAVLPDLEL